MKKNVKSIISYIAISTIIFTNTFIYGDNIEKSSNVEEVKPQEQVEVLVEQNNKNKEVEKSGSAKEVEKIEIIDDVNNLPKENRQVEEVKEIEPEKKSETITVLDPVPVSEIVAHKPAPVPTKFVNSSGKYTLQQIEADIKKITDHYGEIATLEMIGKSYEGEPINAIKLGIQSSIKKPNILLMGNIHAREDFSATLVMKMLDYITYHYYNGGQWGNYNIKEILNEVDIYFIPVANPDGLNIAHHGIGASSNYEYLKTIQNIARDDRWWKSNGRGVDLNRNFDDGNWHLRGNTRPSSEGYRGVSPSSEVETQVIQKFCEEKNPLLAISYHTSGNLFYWADSDTHGVFKGIDTQIINRMKNITGYKVSPVSTNPASFGSGFENWFKKRFYRLGICVELSPSPGKAFVQHDDENFDSLVWSKAKFTGIQLALEAIDIESKMFNVYQGDNYLKTFYTPIEAKAYSKRWGNSNVRRMVYHVYQNNNYLRTFYTHKEAMSYARRWIGYNIVKEEIRI